VVCSQGFRFESEVYESMGLISINWQSEVERRLATRRTSINNQLGPATLHFLLVIIELPIRIKCFPVVTPSRRHPFPIWSQDARAAIGIRRRPILTGALQFLMDMVERSHTEWRHVLDSKLIARPRSRAVSRGRFVG
jgi:hypothetical protein